MRSIEIVFLGTGTPRPSAVRFQTANLLKVDGTPYLIDCGEGATYQLVRAGVPVHEIRHLWITHLHTDHILGYGQFLIGGWMDGRRELTVYGPKGTKLMHERVLALYEEDINYRMRLGRPGNGLYDVEILEIESPGPINSKLPFQVEASEMIHDVTTYGFRFEIDDAAVVFSGDTAYTPALVELARDADVLVQDAVLADRKSEWRKEGGQIASNLRKVHCSPSQCAEIATMAQCRHLVLTHLFDDVDESKAYQDAYSKFSGKVTVAHDLDVIFVR